MFGFEFANRKKIHNFPSYDNALTISSDSIESISPLVWQEHCVECAMPACYGTCSHYNRRVDGRCKLFKYGIEKSKNKSAILSQNIVIDMNEWAKLETLFFPASYSYSKLCKLNILVSFLGNLAQLLKLGKIRRIFYYIKEFVTRKLGNVNKNIPDFFLCEIFNLDKPYSLNLETRANNQIMFRTILQVNNNGYNRFIIPTSEFKYLDGYINYLSIYPEKNLPQKINFISLELVSFKSEYLKKILPQSNKKVKCVVWDLDGTIWNGILAEDGIDDIQKKNEIIENIKKLDSKGIINSVVSKNYEDTAIEALKKIGIYDYFVCPFINWNAKSQNIKLIAKTLDIGLDTFVFVDDSFFELNEVQINCPLVRCCNVEDISDYVNTDIFDVPITEESKNRRKSYQEISIRNKMSKQFDDITDFLKSCNMVALVNKPNDNEIERCYELVQRTNQLNISAERLSLEEIKNIIQSEEYNCYSIKVSDKFGDYGLVGFAIFDTSDSVQLVLKHFVFSCRAARKKIEQSFFEYIIDKYKKQYQKLVLICKKTEKNKLMQSVLEESGLFEKQELSDNSFLLTHEMSKKIIPQNIIKFQEV